MNTRHPSRVIAGAALLALVLSFIAPFPVLAEETAPPAEPTAEAPLLPDPAAPEAEAMPIPAEDALLPQDESTEAAPTDAPASVEAEPTQATPPDEGEADESEVVELIALAPDGTTIAVVGETGELLPLASEAAADVIAAGDPIWCPASVKAPTPLANGCTDSYTSFAALLGALALPGVVPADGIIWIASDYNSSLDLSLVEIDGTWLTSLAPFKLTLRGGWSGTPGDKTITPVDPDNLGAATRFDGTRLYIHDWGNDITLSDLVITNTTGTALRVETDGNISLTRVFSYDNAGTGANLNNTSALSAKAVTITASQFNNNGNQGGLYVRSTGKITLSNVIANSNATMTGAYLDNTFALTPQAVVLTGLNTFNTNGTTGLVVNSIGAITGADLTATGNGDPLAGWGAELYNTSAPSAQAVTLSGTNIFCDNYSGGLNIASAGAIKLNNIIADSNDQGVGLGAQLNNTSATSDQPITLTGSSTFKYNMAQGLYIASRGPVTLNNITANGNGGSDGLEITTGSSLSAGVTLTGTNTFNDNVDDGLYVWSNGPIKLNNVTALDNGWGSGNGYGVTVYNSGSPTSPGITLTGTNNLSGNRYQGLSLRTKGPVAISNLTASDNNHHGADIDNSTAPTPQKVTLTGKNVFSGNANYGLLVYSLGAIAASNLTVSGNGHAPGGLPGAYLYNAGVGGAGGVTLSGVNRFTDNGRNGLQVSSKGVISLSSVTATGNGFIGSSGSGANLSNDYAAAPGAGLTLSGTNLFSENYDSGLIAYSKGPISLSNLTASGNQNGYGVDAGNANLNPDDPPQKFTLSGYGAFHDNSQTGFGLYSRGAITLASFSASGNGQYGAIVNNNSGTSAQPVTLSGNYTVNDNVQTGMSIYSLGLIKVSNVTASHNGSSGMVLANNTAPYTGGITLSGKNTITDNYWTGLGLYSNGPISASSLTAMGNGIDGGSGYGADIENIWAVTAQPVKLTGTNVFSGNQSTGLYVGASGAVSVSNLTASGNVAGSGAILSNDDPFSAPVTLTGAATFNDNYGHGLQVGSWGAINLSTTRLEASHNGVTFGYGVSVANSGSPSPQKVALKGPVFVNDNYAEGLYLQSKGAVTINSLTASNARHGSGAVITNDFAGAIGGVTLGGTNVLQDNWGQGLALNSLGAVTINNLSATGNGFGNSSGTGASIANFQFPVVAPQPVKLTGVNNLSGNYGAGLWIRSNGSISLNSLTASDSYRGHGVDLANDDADSIGGITLSGTNAFNDNYNSGLEAYSLGAITVNNLTASGNGISNVWGFGAILDNDDSLTPLPVKLTGSNTFNNNLLDGLFVNSRGAISASNLTANGSRTGGGVALNNDHGDALGVTITGTNAFSGNFTTGLDITSAGAVSLTKIYADGNGASGLYVSNIDADVTVTCGSFVNNVQYGVYTFTSGTLKLVGVVASGNTPAGDIRLQGGGTLAIVRACPLP